MTQKVLVMVDERGQLRGKSHSPQCAHAQRWAVQGHGHGYGPRPYQLVDVSSVRTTLILRVCGGGR